MTESNANQNPEGNANKSFAIDPIVAELIAAQGDLSDVEFCREYNFKFSDSTWSRVRRGIYAGDMRKVLNEVEATLRRVRERKALAAKVRQGTRYVEFPPARTILDRISILQTSTSQNRLLMYLAPTGGGKSALGREITARFGGIQVEAKESWRNNYFAALVEVCDAAGCSGDDHVRSPRHAEKALIAQLCARKQVLVIDEGEYFGPKSLNLIKLILNQTPTVVILMAIPILWDRVKSKAWTEASQIMRRTDHVEQLVNVHPGEVKAFLQAAGVDLNGMADESSRLIARHCNEFGRFDLLTRVAERLSDGEPKTLAEIETCVLSIKAMIGLGGAR